MVMARHAAVIRPRGNRPLDKCPVTAAQSGWTVITTMGVIWRRGPSGTGEDDFAKSFAKFPAAAGAPATSRSALEEVNLPVVGTAAGIFAVPDNVSSGCDEARLT